MNHCHKSIVNYYEQCEIDLKLIDIIFTTIKITSLMNQQTMENADVK